MKFGPERRLRKRPEFLQVQGQGRRASTEHFVWILARGPEAAAPSRVGITASKRVGNSVQRSRIKRIVRAAFRLEEGMVPHGWDLVVICKRDASALSSQEVRRQWRSTKKRFRKSFEG